MGAADRNAPDLVLGVYFRMNFDDRSPAWRIRGQEWIKAGQLTGPDPTFNQTPNLEGHIRRVELGSIHLPVLQEHPDELTRGAEIVVEH
jgi:hypothetical protein